MKLPLLNRPDTLAVDPAAVPTIKPETVRSPTAGWKRYAVALAALAWANYTLQGLLEQRVEQLDEVEATLAKSRGTLRDTVEAIVATRTELTRLETVRTDQLDQLDVNAIRPLLDDPAADQADDRAAEDAVDGTAG